MADEQSGFIADIGFETYQKILSEAMAELREEEFAKAAEAGRTIASGDVALQGGSVHSVPGGSIAGQADMNGSAFPGVTSPQDGGGTVAYISDCQIETDREAVIPDSYVSSAGEKLRLYRELDSITDEERLARFESQLTDRFGDIPTATHELFDIVRLRWICIRLGFEKAIVKTAS